jgi:hypothetical protein
VSPRTLTPAVTDRSMWRKLLRVLHPDSGAGDGELFVWCRNLQAYVGGDHLEEPPPRARRDPPKHPKPSERIDYAEAFQRADSFETLTRAAVMYAEEVGEPYAGGNGSRSIAAWSSSTPSSPASMRRQHRGWKLITKK